jgi:hypothetical protein
MTCHIPRADSELGDRRIFLRRESVHYRKDIERTDSFSVIRKNIIDDAHNGQHQEVE